MAQVKGSYIKLRKIRDDNYSGKMKDITATIIIDLQGKSEDEILKGINRSRRKDIKIAKDSGLYYEKSCSEEDLKKMYDLHSRILIEGGSINMRYEKWKEYVKKAGDRFFFIKRENIIIGCFILGETTERSFGMDSDKIGLLPLVFASYKEYNSYKPNDFMYWCTIKYALDKGYPYIDLGGWQVKARGHMKGINFFKETWGGRIVYYYPEYPFFKALGRKIIRNIGIFWWLNILIKRFLRYNDWRRYHISKNDSLDASIRS